MIEREIPKVGTLEGKQLQEAAAKSNEVLRQLGPDIQRSESFLTADKMFCVYLAKDEAIIQRHAELSFSCRQDHGNRQQDCPPTGAR